MFAGEKLLAAKRAERNEHLRDEGHIGDESGGRGIYKPLRVFFFHLGMGVLEGKPPATMASAAGAGISGSIRGIKNSHYLSLLGSAIK